MADEKPIELSDDDKTKIIEQVTSMSKQDQILLLGLLGANLLSALESPALNYSLSPQSGPNAGKFLGMTITLDREYHEINDANAQAIFGRAWKAGGSGKDFDSEFQKIEELRQADVHPDDEPVDPSTLN